MTRRVPLAAPALALAVLALAPPAAFGHAAFVGATPPPGGRVDTAPERIVLRFSEPLNRELTEATLRAADGRRIAARQGIRGQRIVLVAPRALDRGAYRVEWRTVSTDDAHPLEGSYGFGVRAPAGAGSHGVEQSPLAGGGWARALSRGLLYAALLLFAGALLVRALLGPGWPVPRRSSSPPPGPIAPPPTPGGGVATLARPRAPVQGASLPGAEAALARADALVLDAGLATAGLAALSAIVDASVAAGGFSVGALDDYLLASQPGVARIALVGIALVAVALARRAPRVAALAALAALGCVVASGHANSADPRGLAILADWAHLAGGAVWLGGAGLIALAWGPGLRDGATRSAVMRDVLPAFGRIALPAFALVVAAGLVNAVVELGSVRALLDSSYGLVLLAKIALVAGAAGAAFVHVRLRARAAGDPSGERRGWRALRVEVALGAGVVAAAGLLVAFPLPPRQLDATAEGLAATSACDPCPLPAPRADELAVADQAGGLVVAAWIRREPRRLTGTIRTLDFRGRPARGPIGVPGGRTRPCGTGCARFTLAGAPPTLRATVAVRGRTFTARLPARWERGASARARRLLDRAERTMRALRSVREDELVTSGPGTRAIARYALRAPDRLFFVTDRGVRTIQIGRRQWLRTAGEPWSVGPIPGGLPFRMRSWFRWTPYARVVEWLGERRGIVELAAADPATPVWFRLSVDERTGRVLREELVARARLIRHRFFGFNGRVTIVAPKDAVRAG
jgi:copper transport protein